MRREQISLTAKLTDSDNNTKKNSEKGTKTIFIDINNMNKKEDDESSFLNDRQDTLESYFQNRKSEESVLLSFAQ